MKGYIYQIINKINGKRYIGQTIDIKRRYRTHFMKLRKNIHPNHLLQMAWNKYGEESFNFYYEEFEIASSKELDKLEIETIAKYNSLKNGYNCTSGGEGGITR